MKQKICPCVSAERTRESRLRLKCDDTRRNQISSFGETDESI